MPTLNKVFLLGNLTRDPDLRGLPSGQSVCEMRLAITRRYISNGKEVDETCFVDVVVWGKSANNCKQFLTKGSQIMVEGRLQLDQWEDRNGGGQRSKLRVVADQVQFMNRRPQEGGTYPPGITAPIRMAIPTVRPATPAIPSRIWVTVHPATPVIPSRMATECAAETTPMLPVTTAAPTAVPIPDTIHTAVPSIRPRRRNPCPPSRLRATRAATEWLMISRFNCINKY